MAMSGQPPSPSGALTSDDLHKVFEALYSIAPNYVNFGMKLKVHLNTIKIFEVQYASPYDCLLEVLDYRLKQLPPLTWRSIVQALRSPTMEQHDIAKAIESQYITASQSRASISRQASVDSIHAAIHAAGAPAYTHAPQEHVPPQDVCTLYPQQFTSFIKDTYRRNTAGDSRKSKWPPTASKMFIKLAIIDRRTLLVKKADAYTKAMVMDGNVDVILQRKRPIELSQIAKDIPESKIIVVEGAPCVGKSTFASEFCRLWESGEIAQQYQLVLLLRLRDERMSRAQNVNDFIYHPNKKVCQSMQHELRANDGSNVLFIFEGFDELPDSCRAETSIFRKVISGDLLPNATVLITSRPWATGVIHQANKERIFRHIEIMGFTELQMKEYVAGALSNPDNDFTENAMEDFDDIIKYIDAYPQIKACMYVPLNAAIVVGVYEESKAGRCNLPKTLTQLYYASVQTILHCYLHEHPEYSQYRWNIRDWKKDLPPEMYTRFLQICQIAYEGICNSKENIQLVFCKLPADFEALGLMQSIPQMYVTQEEVMSHNFLHLAIQEFLAALHISSFSPEKKLQHFQRQKEGRLRVVLKFLAGLTKLSEIGFDDFRGLLGEEHKDEGDGQQRDYCKHMMPNVSLSADHTNWMFEAQNTDILKSLLQNQTVELDFTHDMQPLEYYSIGYCMVHSHCNWSLRVIGDMEIEKLKMLLRGAETRNSDMLRLALRTKEPMSSKKLHDLVAGFGPCLEELYLKVEDNSSPIFLSSFSALHILELEMCCYCKYSFIYSDMSFRSLESLTIGAEFVGNPLGLKSCEAIGKFLSTSVYLKELHFTARRSSWSMSSVGMEAITKGMSDNIALALRSFKIECDCTFSNLAATYLAVFIGRSTTLEYVRLSNVTFTGYGLIEITEALHQCSSLQEKKLEVALLLMKASDNEVTKLNQMFHDYPGMLDSVDWKTVFNRSFQGAFNDEKARVLAFAIHHNLTKDTLDLRSYNISNAAVAAVARAFHHNSTIKQMDLSSNSINDAGAAALAQALHYNTTLEGLDLFNNTIGYAGVAALAQALHHNSTLFNLYLPKNRISDAGAAALAQALHYTSSLQRMNLCSNTITDDGATALAQALHHNSTLEWLKLSNNNISDVGAAALAQALHHNSTITWLILSNNNISDVGAAALAQALHRNSILKELNLFKNKISDAGTVAIAQAIHHNSTLEKLNLSSNCISDAGATALAQALHQSSILVELYLSNNSISDAGAVVLAQALHHNSTLELLHLSGNADIGEVGAREVLQALTVNKSIRFWGLKLPRRCIVSAIQCTEYNAVKNKIRFGS